jgi:transcriptional regulator with XRE-family HTH domain
MSLSQAQVAEVLGIPRAAVSAIESGRRRVSSLELKKLGELFGASVDRLLGNDVKEDPTAAALFRTAKVLTPEDRQQVLRFAEFLRGAGPAPSVTFDPDDE